MCCSFFRSCFQRALVKQKNSDGSTRHRKILYLILRPSWLRPCRMWRLCSGPKPVEMASIGCISTDNGW